MSTMSRSTTMEFIGQMKRRYITLDKNGKTEMLNDVCEHFGLERKYTGKLLTGNRWYKDPKGRGKKYSDQALKLLRRVWYASGCMCTKYLKACIGRLLRDLAEAEHVDAGTAKEVEQMSASTMDRALRGLPRRGPGSTRRNRRSGANAVAPLFTCISGELVPACDLPPGHLQIDTVALCGGNMGGNFFWILTVTDRKSQWFEMLPVWNKGAEAVLGALRKILRRLPFKPLSIHCDNGSEFINAHLARFCAAHPEIRFERSRPYRKNDNAHIEQKNGSVVRELFGEGRIDDPELGPELEKLCMEASDLFNNCKPCVMLVSRHKKDTGKGFSKKYDEPATPAERLLREGCVTEKTKRSITARGDRINVVMFRRFILRRLSRIRRKQRKHENTDNNISMELKPQEETAHTQKKIIRYLPRRKDLALRATPPGTSYASGKVSGRKKKQAGKAPRREKFGVLVNDESS